MGRWPGPSPSSCPSSRCDLGQRAPPLCLAVFVGTGGDNRCFSVGVGGGTGLWPCSGEWGPEAGLASLLLPRPLPLPFPGVPDSPPLYS